MKILEVAIAFVALDRPGCNVVSSASYMHLCTLLHERSDFFECLPKAFVELFPAREQGTPLRFREWVVAAGAWCIITIRGQCADELRKIFMRYDLDGSGQIDRSEFEAIVRELINQVICPAEEQQAACDQIAQGIADEILDNADLDDSGQVDYSEFWDCVRHIMSKQGELVHALKTATTLEQVQRVTVANPRRRGSNFNSQAGSVLTTGGKSGSQLGASLWKDVKSTRSEKDSKDSKERADLGAASQSSGATENAENHSVGSPPPGVFSEAGNSSFEIGNDASNNNAEVALSSNGELTQRKGSKELQRAGSKESRGSFLSRGSSSKGSKGKENSELVPISPAGKIGSPLQGSRRK
jgi:hypothetical protein